MPSFFRASSYDFLRRVIALTLLAAFSFANGAWAAGPGAPEWWTTRGVLAPETTEDDYALLNLGQLKNLAAAAAVEMNATLPGGAGAAINDMVLAWINSTEEADDFATVNIGQLKAVAAPFFDRMTALGLTATRPWSATAIDDDDYELATIGQAKFLFSFPISAAGLPDPLAVDPGASVPGGNNTGYGNGSSSYTPPGGQTWSFVDLEEGSIQDFACNIILPPTGADAEPATGFKSRWIARHYSATYDPDDPNDSEWWHINSDMPTSHWSQFDRGFGEMPSNWEGPGVFGGFGAWYGGWQNPGVGVAHQTSWYYDANADPPEWQYLGAERRCWESRLAITTPGPHKAVTKRYRIYRQVGESPVKYDSSIHTFTIHATNSFSSHTVEFEPTVTPASMDTEVYRADALPTLPPFTITNGDGAGPKHRKVGLTGVSLSDSKPQNQDESGELAEETFVDAYTRQLRHSVSDVYVSTESSLLPLMVRRDLVPDSWSPKSGLQPAERPDRPFGMGWSSNLTPHITFVGGRRAIVTDEQGGTRTFVLHPDGTWRNSRGERYDGKTAFDTLEVEKNLAGQVIAYVLRKKFGTTCYYSASGIFYQYIPNDRVNGSTSTTYYAYARMTQATDRLGNAIHYEYGYQYPAASARNLIPKRIYDPARPALQISIQQSGGRITQLRGPSGETVSYSYDGDTLASVTRGGHTVSYGFGQLTEVQPAEEALGETLPTVYYHTVLQSLTDEREGVYSFTHEANLSVKYMELIPNITLQRIQHGLPPLLNTVTLPGASAPVRYDTGSTRNIEISQQGTLDLCEVSTQVSGPAGTFTYTFSEPELFVPVQADPGDEHQFSQQVTLSFKRLDLACAAGTETFVFSPAAGMGLASVTDLSGNTTTFGYADEWTHEGQSGFFDDPNTGTNALGGVKTLVYDTGTRVLKKITDARGVVTEYDIQAGTGLRTKETITDPQTGALRVTDFAYGNGTFPGFLTQRTVQAGTGAASAHAPAIVTTFTADANGRVAREEAHVGGSFLRTSYTYTPSGSKSTVTDPRGHTTSFLYEPESLRLVRVMHPDATFKQLAYDAHGNLTREQDENGVATLHEYDARNRRTLSALDADGNNAVSARATTSMASGGLAPWRYDGDLVTQTTYNEFNLPATTTDARGLVTAYEYDALGRLTTTIVMPDGNGQATADSLVTTFAYGTNSGGSVFNVSGFKPTASTSPRGVVTQVVYDKLYRATQTSVIDATLDPAPTYTTSTQYDAVGNPTQVTDALNRTTVTHFDGLNRAYQVDLPSGGTPAVAAASRHAHYTPAGQVWKSVDEAGRETLVYYDGTGRPFRALGPVLADLSRPETLSYHDAAGNVTAVTDARGYTTDTSYDSRNRPVTVTAPPVLDGETGDTVRPTTTTLYDRVGRVHTVIDPLQQRTTTLYDRAGRVGKVTNPLNQSTISRCDAGGNVHTVIDPNGRPTTNLYDDLGRLWRTVDATLHVTEFGYDKAGNRTLVKVYDGAGKETHFTYDGLNRVLSETHANDDVTTYTYDALRKLTRTDEAGTTSYGYDVRDRLTSVSPTGQPARAHAYDAASRLLSVTESGNAVADVSYTYDALGRVLTETSRGLTHTHTYDISGNRLTTAYADGRSETRTYDGLDRIRSLSEGGRVTTWHYDAAGRAISLSLPNGQQQDNYHDAAGRLVSRHLFGTAGALLATFMWLHDAAGNVKRQSEQWPGDPARSGQRVTLMGYDHANRLLTETVESTAQPLKETLYTYDPSGNRETKVEKTGGVVQKDVSYTYNAANQLTAWEEKDGAAAVLRSATLGYDANGNRDTQTITPNGGTGLTTTYAWTAENRLASVTLPDTTVHSYAYDYRMRRITRTEDTTTTAMTFSGGLSVAEYDVATASSSIPNPASSTVSYQRGPDMGGGVGGLLYSLRDSTPKFNLSNGRGDVVAQSDSAGALTWTASYEAYGKRPEETGSNADRQRANTKEEDPTGLLNEGFRYRDIDTGVWLSRDPAGFVDGPNLYAYCVQNPWSKFDPDGQFWSAIITAGFAAYDTYQYATGKTTGKEYAAAMALNGAALLADVATAGNGGGLAVRAANATIKVAKVVDKANTMVDTAQAAVEVTENVVAAVESGDGRRMASTVGGAVLDAATDKALGARVKKKAPPPNGGFGPKHGNQDHEDAINAKADDVRAEGGENVRKNQRQVDIEGNQAGTNKPDLQWDKDGEHHNWETDRTKRSSEKHQREIPKNDPKSVNHFEMLEET